MLNEARKIALLLARLLGLKVDGKFDEFNTAFDDALLNEYNIETEKLLALTEDEFKAQVSAADYSTEKLNALSQLLYMYAEPFEADEETVLLLKKVMIIFDLLETDHHYESFENLDKRSTIYRYFNDNYGS
ncbi:hypothetical protein IM792_14920 [Mucilaginibacter sp. JRF]|uniref:hypothetical protein n=1 Tax=Mucilaginibacter sp. JRF TaxID=2780088 RepID=UPI001880F336|nr:hypothetical protein [Mucilaginibacter sp. JRF]MBE9585746.1 hypothetical protein [Mucilaginibacter sp. JRF]